MIKTNYVKIFLSLILCVFITVVQLETITYNFQPFKFNFDLINDLDLTCCQYSLNFLCV